MLRKELSRLRAQHAPSPVCNNNVTCVANSNPSTTVTTNGNTSNINNNSSTVNNFNSVTVNGSATSVASDIEESSDITELTAELERENMNYKSKTNFVQKQLIQLKNEIQVLKKLVSCSAEATSSMYYKSHYRNSRFGNKATQTLLLECLCEKDVFSRKRQLRWIKSTNRNKRAASTSTLRTAKRLRVPRKVAWRSSSSSKSSQLETEYYKVYI